MILKLVTLICLASASAAKYSDCDASDFHEIGNFGKADFHSEIMNSTTFYSVLPADTTRPVPLVVFMHGSTGQWEFYNDNLSILASHGAAVVFPFVKSPEADKHFWTTNTDGTYLVKAIEYAREMNENPEHAFYGRIDTDNIVIAGHSMGATCSINASNKLLGDEAIKLTIALHPGICGPFGPPPCPSCWKKATLAAVSEHHPVIVTTATNDNAFRGVPGTANAERECFEGAIASTTNGIPIAFVQFSEEVCTDDGNRQPIVDDGGHDCSMKRLEDGESVEFELLLKAVKLYAQLGGDEKSACYESIYGATGLAASNTTDVLDIRN